MLTHELGSARDSLWFGYTQQSYWQLFSGVSLTHQSNGQALPLSRNWNRVILIVGLEKDDHFQLTGRLWQRLPEKADDDDNPDINDINDSPDMVRRAEVSGSWHVNKFNTLDFTLRHSLRTGANGSLRLEWLKVLGGGNKGLDSSGLRFHTQLFSGYGDSLADYNRQRTVLSIGLMPGGLVATGRLARQRFGLFIQRPDGCAIRPAVPRRSRACRKKPPARY